MGQITTIYWLSSSHHISKSESHKLQQSVLKRIINKHPIINREKGKPFLTNSSLEFSVSHTQKTWVMAVSEAAIGIDIESIHRTISIKLLNRGQAPQPNIPALARVLKWTQFEAAAKLKGLGIRFPIPAAFSSALKSFVWQSLMVTVASSDPLSAVYVVQCLFPQNGYEWSDETWQSLQPFALTLESNLTTPIPIPDDLTSALDPIVLHDEASKY